MVDANTCSLIGPMKLSSDQPYPNELFASLKEQLDCQAVLFSELTNLRHVAHVGRVAHEVIDTDSLQTIWETTNSMTAAACCYRGFQYEAEIGAGFASRIQNWFWLPGFSANTPTFCFFDPAVTLNK